MLGLRTQLGTQLGTQLECTSDLALVVFRSRACRFSRSPSSLGAMPARKGKKVASGQPESASGATNEPSAPPAVPPAENAAATDARAPEPEDPGSRSAGDDQRGSGAVARAVVRGAAGGSGDRDLALLFGDKEIDGPPAAPAGQIVPFIDFDPTDPNHRCAFSHASL